MSKSTVLFVAARKGAHVVRGNADRTRSDLEGSQFLGGATHDIVADPRAPGGVPTGVRAGHPAPTVCRSSDWGRTRTTPARRVPHVHSIATAEL